MTAEARTSARLPAVRALGGNHDFRLLWIGQAASELGSSISALALPMLVLALSGSAALAGLLGTLAYVAAWLGQLPGGYIADMFDRRRVMLVCDAGRAVLAGLAVVSVLTSTAPVAVLLTVVCASTFLWMAFAAAQTQSVRMIVPPEAIPDAVSINQARGYAVDIGAPVIAGWLFTLHHAMPLVVDAATFVVSFACVWCLRATFAAETRPTMRRFLPDMGRGWSVLRRQPFLWATALYSMVTNFAMSMLLFTLILGGSGGLLVGTGVSVAAAAGLLGSLLAPAVARRVTLRPLLVVVALTRAGSLALAAVSGNGTVFVAVLAVVLLAGPMVGASLTSAQILMVPGDVLGRVSSASRFLGTAAQPLAPVIAGLLVQHFDLRATQLVLTAAFGVVALYAALAPGFRHGVGPADPA
ncbi:MFS transporter [Streptomyces sp. NPDC051976]|uniref:MFS transporter n=1 Tax=Streptomyces sp. NPDC051976 TaxID=3154947 RepID=UPI003442C903